MRRIWRRIQRFFFLCFFISYWLGNGVLKRDLFVCIERLIVTNFPLVEGC